MPSERHTTPRTEQGMCSHVAQSRWPLTLGMGQGRLTSVVCSWVCEAGPVTPTIQSEWWVMNGYFLLVQKWGRWDQRPPSPPSLGALGNLRYGAEFEANAPVPEVLVLGGREPHRLG